VDTETEPARAKVSMLACLSYVSVCEPAPTPVRSTADRVVGESESWIVLSSILMT
jgi:hypothetical protein